jgi:hypothetical protein
MAGIGEATWLQQAVDHARVAAALLLKHGRQERRQPQQQQPLQRNGNYWLHQALL